MDFDMSKKVEFDKNFSYATHDLNIENNDIDNNHYLLLHSIVRDTHNTENVTKSINNCDKENKIIKEQAEQTVSLLNIISLYQTEHDKIIKQQYIYSNTYAKANELRKLLNIITMLFILTIGIIIFYLC
jgi:hypothetical protein